MLSALGVKWTCLLRVCRYFLHREYFNILIFCSKIFYYTRMAVSERVPVFPCVILSKIANHF